MIRDTTIGAKLWATAVWALVGFFVLNLFAHDRAPSWSSSFATRWLGTWLPAGWTTRWYARAWDEFQLGDVLIVTFQIVVRWWCCSPACSACRRPMRWRGATSPASGCVMLLFLLPLLVPPITFGIPLATVLYRAGLAGTMSGVVLANLVPTVPFVILVMIPFIEQIDPQIEAAARVFGANTFKLFIHVLLPLLLPGILAALLLVLVRTIAMFELTFLTAGPTSQTLVVALYYAVFAAGVRAGAVDRRHGGDLHGDDAGLAADRAALRQPDADRRPRQAGARRIDDASSRRDARRACRPTSRVPRYDRPRSRDRHRPSRHRRLPPRPSGRLCRRPCSPPARRGWAICGAQPALARHRATRSRRRTASTRSPSAPARASACASSARVRRLLVAPQDPEALLARHGRSGRPHRLA